MHVRIFSLVGRYFFRRRYNNLWSRMQKLQEKHILVRVPILIIHRIWLSSIHFASVGLGVSVSHDLGEIACDIACNLMMLFAAMRYAH